MLVTFLYHLPKVKRPFSHYLQQLRKLLTLVQKNGLTIRVFFDDNETSDLCSEFSCCVPSRRPQHAWWAVSQQDAIASAMKPRKERFSVPEFCSEEYVGLVLSKFEALYLASLETMDCCFWIDAGLLDYMLRDNLKDYVTNSGIHAVQFGSVPLCEAWIYELPGSHIMGGCFGGKGPDVRRLFTQSVNVLKEFWKRSISLSDQQLLSILHVRFPSQFHVKCQFEQWVPLVSRGMWSRVLSVIDKSEDEAVGSLPAVFLMFALCILLVGNRLKT